MTTEGGFRSEQDSLYVRLFHWRTMLRARICNILFANRIHLHNRLECPADSFGMRERSIPCLEVEMKLLRNRNLNYAAALLLGCVMTAPQTMLAQDHVVSPGQIQNDVTSSSATRQRNEQELRGFLSRKEIQKAMKSEGVNPQQVTNAVSQLNDADLANLAARSQKAQKDYAAGMIGLGIFTLIGIVVVAVILIAVFA